MKPLWSRLADARVIDLANPLHRGMPVSPNHPPFQLSLMRRHGDMVREDGGSAANEIIVTGGHVGTHLDALAHVSHEGLLHGGIDAASVQSNLGFSELGIDTVEPIICRGVLLDIPAVHAVDVLEPGYEISVSDLEAAAHLGGIEVKAGDAVLIRSGWSEHWSIPEQFVGLSHGTPGPGEEAANWLAERDIRLAGGETIAFEVVHPGQGHAVLPAHRILLVEGGIHIIEVMNLQKLADAGVTEFAFVVAPLKIVGGTGSPIRPVALVDA
ncbi:MAG: cyclase family protein [Acidimicrobiia bacterium]